MIQDPRSLVDAIVLIVIWLVYTAIIFKERND